MKLGIVLLFLVFLVVFLAACIPATPYYDFYTLHATETKIAEYQITRRAEAQELSRKFDTPTLEAADKKVELVKPVAVEPTPSPTVVEAIQVAEAAFHLESASQERPEFILDVIDFWNSPAEAHQVGCSQEFVAPAVDPASKTQFEILNYLFVTFCGWQNGEKVQVKLDFPDGRSLTQEYTAESPSESGKSPFIMATYLIEAGDPAGNYQLTAQGEQSGQVVFPFLVTRPEHPRLVQMPEEKVLLSYFQPFEVVRLFIYENSGSLRYRFKNWQEFKVDENGQLLVQVTEACQTDCYFAAIGESSGEAYDGLSSQKYMSIRTSTPAELQCPASPLQRLSVGKHAYVCTGQAALKMYRQPRTSAPLLAELAPGTYFEIIKGPVCFKDLTFWRIRLPSKRSGWVIEGENSPGGYLLCPAP
jgi:hypothetical protein